MGLGESERMAGPPKVQGDLLAYGHLLDAPSVESDEARGSGNHASHRGNNGMSHAIGSGYGDEFRVWVYRDPSFHVGCMSAHFPFITGGSQGVDFGQTQTRNSSP